MIKTKEAIESLIEQLEQSNPAIITSVSQELISLAPHTVPPLIKAYNQCLDQGVQAKLISILAKIGDDHALDLLVEIVGVDVANHCQGNVRRVAARGLGKMVTTKTAELQRLKAVNKLLWALLNTEDWGLRYAAALSLKEIATKHPFASITTEINKSLERAIAQESDQVVQTRIKLLQTN
jgi:bilin biosynthesis PecF protein